MGNNDKQPILCIYNTHSQDSEQPPEGITNQGRYVGYFANEFGNQWVFTFDHASQRATLRGGDAGWEKVYEIVNGEARSLVLSENELAWLRLCWDAATMFLQEEKTDV